MAFTICICVDCGSDNTNSETLCGPCEQRRMLRSVQIGKDGQYLHHNGRYLHYNVPIIKCIKCMGNCSKTWMMDDEDLCINCAHFKKVYCICPKCKKLSRVKNMRDDVRAGCYFFLPARFEKEYSPHNDK